MIRCACLVVEKHKKLMLVRVRDNTLYYFAGGKIEANETAEEALHREIQEELGVGLISGSVAYLTTVHGAALDSEETVELICFSGELDARSVSRVN